MKKSARVRNTFLHGGWCGCWIFYRATQVRTNFQYSKIILLIYLFGCKLSYASRWHNCSMHASHPMGTRFNSHSERTFCVKWIVHKVVQKRRKQEPHHSIIRENYRLLLMQKYGRVMLGTINSCAPVSNYMFITCYADGFFTSVSSEKKNTKMKKMFFPRFPFRIWSALKEIRIAM